MPAIIKSLSVHAAHSGEDARILAKLNSVTPHLYLGSAHKTARHLLEESLDAIIAANGIDYRYYLSAMAAG